MIYKLRYFWCVFFISIVVTCLSLMSYFSEQKTHIFENTTAVKVNIQSIGGNLLIKPTKYLVDFPKAKSTVLTVGSGKKAKIYSDSVYFVNKQHEKLGKQTIYVDKFNRFYVKQPKRFTVAKWFHIPSEVMFDVLFYIALPLLNVTVLIVSLLIDLMTYNKSVRGLSKYQRKMIELDDLAEHEITGF